MSIIYIVYILEYGKNEEGKIGMKRRGRNEKIEQNRNQKSEGKQQAKKEGRLWNISVRKEK